MPNPRPHPYRTMVAAVLVALVTLSGCAAKKELWYQAGKGQVDYNRDEQECTLIAKAFARQATISGTSEDPAALQRVLINCLAGKGWSMTPPQSVGAGAAAAPPAAAAPLAVIDGTRIQAFGSRITLPAGFALSTSSNSGLGPTILQTHLFAGPKDSFVNIIVQRAVAKETRFEYLPYPVRPPLFLYEQGWWGAIFCGKFDDQWVMGLGRYLLLNAKERITVVVTRPLVAPQTAPEPGFHLSREQFAQVEGFKKEWTEWLAVNMTFPPPRWWSRLPFLRRW